MNIKNVVCTAVWCTVHRYVFTQCTLYIVQYIGADLFNSVLVYQVVVVLVEGAVQGHAIRLEEQVLGIGELGFHPSVGDGATYSSPTL